MSRLTKTEAIVFKKKSLLGKDTSLTFFTKQEGKVSVIAKGIKKITSRRASHAQTGNLIEVSLYEKNDRLYLQESKLISAFSDIKAKPEKIKFQYLLFFILDRILPEKQREDNVYILTKNFLVDLAKSEVFSREEMTGYLQKLLLILGYHKSNKPYKDLLRYIEEIMHEKIPPGII